MLWLTKLHRRGSKTQTYEVYELPDNEFTTLEKVANKAIEGYFPGDIDHVEVTLLDEKHIRNWVSFDVKTVLENRG